MGLCSSIIFVNFQYRSYLRSEDNLHIRIPTMHATNSPYKQQLVINIMFPAQHTAGQSIRFLP